MNQNELYHYGVPGMKWGVRHGPPYPIEDGRISQILKKRAKKSTVKKTVPQKTSEEHQEEVKKAKEEAAKAKIERLHTKALKAESAKDVARYSKYLTKDELQAKIDRIRKEKELTDLVSQQNGISTRGPEVKKALFDSFIMKAIAGAGGGIASLATSATVYAGKQFVEKTLGKEVKTEMFNQNSGNNQKK